MFNIRGSDVEFNPVVVAKAVVTTTEAHLFVDPSKLSPPVRAHLEEAAVTLHGYDEIDAYLATLVSQGRAILCDPSQLNWRLHGLLGSAARDGTSPITLPKALKHPAELAGIRASHVRDGVALTAFIHFLEVKIRGDPQGQYTEYDVTEDLEIFRQKMALHRGPSFRYVC